MASVIEKRISCGICSSIRTIKSTTNEFDYGDWKEVFIENDEGGKNMFICEGCLTIFKSMFDDWYNEKVKLNKSQKPKVASKSNTRKK